MSAKTWLLASACGLLLLLPSLGAPPPPVRRHDVTGHIGGLGPHRVTVHLTAALKPSRSAVTHEDGRFIFRDVLAGVYQVRPRHTRFRFSPTFRTLAITSHDISGVNFQAHELPRPHPR
jgi:hypothetical protein